MSAEDTYSIERKLSSYYSLPESAKEVARNLVSSKEAPDYCNDCVFYMMDVNNVNTMMDAQGRNNVNASNANAEISVTGYSCNHPIYTYCEDKSIKLWLIDEDKLIENNWICPRPEQCPIHLAKTILGISQAASKKIPGKTQNIILCDDLFGDLNDLINKKFPFTLDKTNQENEDTDDGRNGTDNTKGT